MTYCCRVRGDNMLYEVKLFMSLLKKLTYQSIRRRPYAE